MLKTMHVVGSENFMGSAYYEVGLSYNIFYS